MHIKFLTTIVKMYNGLRQAKRFERISAINKYSLKILRPKGAKKYTKWYKNASVYKSKYC